MSKRHTITEAEIFDGFSDIEFTYCIASSAGEGIDKQLLLVGLGLLHNCDVVNGRVMFRVVDHDKKLIDTTNLSDAIKLYNEAI